MQASRLAPGAHSGPTIAKRRSVRLRGLGAPWVYALADRLTPHGPPGRAASTEPGIRSPCGENASSCNNLAVPSGADATEDATESSISGRFRACDGVGAASICRAPRGGRQGQIARPRRGARSSIGTVSRHWTGCQAVRSCEIFARLSLGLLSFLRCRRWPTLANRRSASTGSARR